MAEEAAEATAVAEREPGPVAQLLQQALPGVPLAMGQAPLDEVVTVRRDDFAQVMEAVKYDERLAFDYLRCLSGVDYLTELETVYHLYSFFNGHRLAIKVRCPNEDAHVPSVTHLWETANWHERETQELFGIIFDGHPDPRVLLTEEGLGYYIMRKSHPLAEIEEWQEDYLQTIEEAKAQMAAATGVAAPVDEKALKIQLAQKKAALIKQVRDDARSKGLSPEDEKAAVQDAIKKFDEEQAAATAAAPAAAPAAPADPRAAKIALAQQKAKLITKTREEARAKGLPAEEEKAAVAEALKKFSEAQEAAAAPAAPAAPAARAAAPTESRAAKIQLAQQKAALIT
ncbi:MAG: NADH-quinone oxidoreductase subunit C, partial [Burkholderiales bacterium]